MQWRALAVSCPALDSGIAAQLSLLKPGGMFVCACTMAWRGGAGEWEKWPTAESFIAYLEAAHGLRAGAYTRPLLGSI
jgi:hypothetical protein